MKRYFSLLIIASIVLSSSCFSIRAAAFESAPVQVDDSFVGSASVDVTTYDDGLTEISLAGIQETPNIARNSSVETVYKSTALTFLAENQAEKDDILSRISQVRNGGGTIYDDDWFFGDSCYIYISITFTTRNASIGGTEARINSVTTKYSVNSGTYVSNAILHLGCIGVSSDGGSIYLEDDITVTTTPYTNTLMNSWPYISVGGPGLGANFTVTANRASGTSSTHTVSANVFTN